MLFFHFDILAHYVYIMLLAKFHVYFNNTGENEREVRTKLIKNSSCF